MPVRTVFVVGAGASAAVSPTPILTQTLLADVLAEVDNYPHDAVSKARAFTDFLAGTTETPDHRVPGLYDVLSLIDFAIARRAPLGAAWPVERLRAVREAVVSLIFHCIETKIDGTAAKSDTLAQLVRHIVSEGRSAAVVNLNWDSLIEEAVFRRRSRDLRTLDYGLPCCDKSGTAIEPLRTAMLILKPHGSLSWHYCSVCATVIVFLPRSDSRDRPSSCPKCHQKTPLEAVVVAPTLMDWAEPPFLEQLWTTAEQLIAECSRLVFVGYSLPEQDLDVRFHIIRGLARRTSPAQILVIVKQHQGIGDEKQRFTSMLGGYGPIDYRAYANGLADWVPVGLTRDLT